MKRVCGGGGKGGGGWEGGGGGGGGVGGGGIGGVGRGFYLFGLSELVSVSGLWVHSLLV